MLSMEYLLLFLCVYLYIAFMLVVPAMNDRVEMLEHAPELGDPLFSQV